MYYSSVFITKTFNDYNMYMYKQDAWYCDYKKHLTTSETISIYLFIYFIHLFYNEVEIDILMVSPVSLPKTFFSPWRNRLNKKVCHREKNNNKVTLCIVLIWVIFFLLRVFKSKVYYFFTRYFYWRCLKHACICFHMRKVNMNWWVYNRYEKG